MHKFRCLTCLLVSILFATCLLEEGVAQAILPPEVSAALANSGENRSELEKALAQVSDVERPGLHFLLEHMPSSDLTSLKGEFLLENVSLAYKARRESAWGKDLPDDVFLNDVLPYANINERRDSWRKEFHDRFLRFDTNDHLSVALPRGKKFNVEMLQAGVNVSHTFVADENGKLVTLKAEAAKAIEQLAEYLKKPAAERPALAEQAFASATLTKEESQQALELLAADHRESIRQSRKAEMDAKVIKAEGAEMPFEMKVFGEKPKDGRSLVISMHGGGGAPKQVNDRQWQNQKKLYEIEEGIYLAPRAPTDSWNMWHQGHIDALYTRLIENLIAIEDVNPNRVFITGYSAGGDGVFQLAPRMADQLAAAAMMAGHPNETKPDGLRNLPFTLHVGGKDKAYNRNTIAQSWSEKLEELKKADSGGYEHWAKIYPEKRHWMDGEDREGVRWMLKFDRDIVPEKVVWLQDDVVHSRFYWLKVDAAKAKAGDLVVASRTGNKINIEMAQQGKLTLLLRDDMLNLDDEVIVNQGDKELWRGKPVRTVKSIADTLADRGDPAATFCAQLELEVAE